MITTINMQNKKDIIATLAGPGTQTYSSSLREIRSKGAAHQLLAEDKRSYNPDRSFIAELFGLFVDNKLSPAERQIIAPAFTPKTLEMGLLNYASVTNNMHKIDEDQRSYHLIGLALSAKSILEMSDNPVDRYEGLGLQIQYAADEIGSGPRMTVKVPITNGEQAYMFTPAIRLEYRKPS